MSKVNHDIRSNHGRTIYMPEYYEGENGWGNLNIPNVYAADDTATLYPRGTRLVQGERSFYYGTYRGVVNWSEVTPATVTPTQGDDLAFKILFSVAYNQDYATGKLIRKTPGEIDVAVIDTVDDGGRADNWYSGGWISGKDTAPADERMFSRLIEGHSYLATGSETQKFQNGTNGCIAVVDLSAYSDVSILRLDQPVINSKTTMAFVVHTNEWKHVIWQSDTGYKAVHGMLGACMHNNPVATRSVWLQTHGQMFAPHLHTTHSIGSAINESTIIGMSDGSYEVRSLSQDYFATGTFHPIIGHTIGSCKFELGTETEEKLPMIYLTLRR